eukprot:gene8045-9559_t
MAETPTKHAVKWILQKVKLSAALVGRSSIRFVVMKEYAYLQILHCKKYAKIPASDLGKTLNELDPSLLDSEPILESLLGVRGLQELNKKDGFSCDRLRQLEDLLPFSQRNEKTSKADLKLRTQLVLEPLLRPTFSEADLEQFKQKLQEFFPPEFSDIHGFAERRDELITITDATDVTSAVAKFQQRSTSEIQEVQADEQLKERLGLPFFVTLEKQISHFNAYPTALVKPVIHSHCDLLGECGVLVVVGECGVLVVVGVCGVLVVVGECGVLVVVGECDVLVVIARRVRCARCGRAASAVCSLWSASVVCSLWSASAVCSLWSRGERGVLVVVGECGVLVVVGECGVLVLVGECGVLVVVGECGVLVLVGECGVLVVYRENVTSRKLLLQVAHSAQYREKLTSPKLLQVAHSVQYRENQQQQQQAQQQAQAQRVQDGPSPEEAMQAQCELIAALSALAAGSQQALLRFDDAALGSILRQSITTALRCAQYRDCVTACETKQSARSTDRLGSGLAVTGARRYSAYEEGQSDETDVEHEDDEEYLAEEEDAISEEEEYLAEEEEEREYLEELEGESEDDGEDGDEEEAEAEAEAEAEEVEADDTSYGMGVSGRVTMGERKRTRDHGSPCESPAANRVESTGLSGRQRSTPQRHAAKRARSIIRECDLGDGDESNCEDGSARNDSSITNDGGGGDGDDGERSVEKAGCTEVLLAGQGDADLTDGNEDSCTAGSRGVHRLEQILIHGVVRDGAGDFMANTGNVAVYADTTT